MQNHKRNLLATGAVLLTVIGTPAFGQAVLSKPGEAIAPLPATIPNLQGVWLTKWITDLSNPKLVEKAVDVPFTAWGKRLWDERLANHQADDTTLQCLPDGLPRQAATPYPMQIVQTPDMVIFLYEGAAHTYRIVPTNGGRHGNQDQLWMGDSVGHYEGDTLVVDVTNFNDKTWLDGYGHPHSDQLHLIERWRRTDRDTLRYEVTIEDPKAYTRPWTTAFNYKLHPDMKLMEYWCNENERDAKHIVGR
jgi:hypothetical protein